MTTLYEIEFADQRTVVDRAVIAASSRTFADSEAASLLGTMNALYGATCFRVKEYAAESSPSRAEDSTRH